MHTLQLVIVPSLDCSLLFIKVNIWFSFHHSRLTITYFYSRVFNSDKVLKLTHSIIHYVQELVATLATRDEDIVGCLRGLVVLTLLCNRVVKSVTPSLEACSVS